MKFAIGLILDQSNDDKIKKIIGFNILNLPEFKEEILLFDDMQKLDKASLEKLGLDMFYNAKEAYI